MVDGLREMIAYDGEATKIQAYLARPMTEEPRPAVIVIHEIVGLTEQVKGVANRFVEEGYVAFAPNLFSRPDLAEVLTPSSVEEVMRFMMAMPTGRMPDPAYMQQAMSQLPEGKRETVQRVLPMMFGGIPKDKLTQDLIKAVEYLNAQSFVQSGKIASVGFCFGGGISINLACHAPLAASVIFYGENPNPIELVEQTAIGRGQEFPGHRAEKGRRDERSRNQRANGLPPRHIGARYQPSHRSGDDGADRGGSRCDNGGRQQRIEEIGIGEQRDEIRQRQMIGFVRDAVDREPGQRHRDQHDQACRGEPQHRFGPVDFAAPAVDCSCDGHARNSRA